MGPIHTLGDFLDMVRRRIGLISFVIILGCMASVFWALSIPHEYRSAEVIQIEQPKIDNDLAPTTVSASSARRLQLIEQQIMSRGSLQEIIEKFDLYDNLTELRPSEKVNLLRESVTISGLAAAREGFADDGTISVLTITAEMDSAKKAQAVAHEIADRTRALAAAQRAEQTRETLAFFQQKEDELVREIAEVEEELADYRRANDLSIEGSLDFVRDEIATLNEAILDLDREIIAAQLGRNNVDQGLRPETVARLEAEFDALLDSLTNQRGLLEDRRAELSASIETSPEVERELAKFDRRLTQLQGQLGVMTARRNEAEVGFSLETAARGERLTTIEEAPLPDYPFTMSRRNRSILGAGASVVIALLLALLMEFRRPVVRTAAQMERETGLRPVVSIPDMRGDTPAGRRGIARLWQNRLISGKKGREARLARYKALSKG